MANETVLFKRGDSATITSTPVTDGQILFDTSGNGKMYLDNGTDRLEMGGAITVDASLSKTSTNAIQNKAVTGNILNSLAEVSAATQQNTIAGALALKEVNSSLNTYELLTSLTSTTSNITVQDLSQFKSIALYAGNTATMKKIRPLGIVPMPLFKTVKDITSRMLVDNTNLCTVVISYVSDTEISCMLANQTKILMVYGVK